MTLFRTMLASALFASVVAGAPLSAQVVTADWDHTVNFYKYKTYTWDKVHATDPGIESRILVAVNRDMLGSQYHEAGTGGDIILTVVQATQDKAEYSSFYDGLTALDSKRSWGAGGFLDTPATVGDVAPATLCLDMYDGKTKKLIWRGTIVQPLAGDAGKDERTIDGAVNKLFAKFPPKPGKGAK